MNIIVVDWAEFFNLNYYQSAMRVVNVAVQVNEYEISDNFFLKLSTFTQISL